MTYDDDKIFALAQDMGEGWRTASVLLAIGETAWCPASTKKVYAGPGWVTYMIHPSGIQSQPTTPTPAALVYG